MNKLIDLRFVIGAFFAIIGLMLLFYGLFTNTQLNNAHLVNKWCGTVFTVFGAFMIILSFGKDAHDELMRDER